MMGEIRVRLAPTQAPTLGEALARGRSNNFDLVRIVAASAVVVSHAWPLAHGPGSAEPLDGVLPVSLGGLAVLVFFFVSGVLVTSSAFRSDRSAFGFAIARTARILPGLAVALCVTGLAFGLSAGRGYGAAEAATYILRGLSLISIQHEVPGLFAANPYPFAANGPLWTLFYEVGLYALLAAAVYSGLAALPAAWGIAGVGIGLVWFWSVAGETPATGPGYRLATGAPLALTFFAGALAARLRGRLPLDWRVGGVLLAAAVALGPHPLSLPVWIAAAGYGVLLVACRLPARPLPADLSYGVYIYGWPVAQGLLALGLLSDPALLAAASLATVLPVAALSWHVVERPSIAFAGERLRRTRWQPASA